MSLHDFIWLRRHRDFALINYGVSVYTLSINHITLALDPLKACLLVGVPLAAYKCINIPTSKRHRHRCPCRWVYSHHFERCLRGLKSAGLVSIHIICLGFREEAESTRPLLITALRSMNGKHGREGQYTRIT